MPDLLAVGSYTPEAGGRGQGITLLERSADSGRLGRVVAQLPTPSPSHLVLGPGPGALLHAAHELDDGVVSTWDPRAGDQLAQVPAGGGHPCHLAVHPSGRLLVVSCYDGTVGVVAVRDGLVHQLVQVLRPTGSGPHGDRQRGPHPHSAAFLGGASVVIADLGTDELRVHAVEVSGGLPVALSRRPVQVVRTAPGAGPRTVLVRGARLHVTAELGAALLTAEVRDGRLGPPRSAAATAAAAAAGSGSGTHGEVPAWPSEVAPFGDHLLVATRGVDVLTVHEDAGGVTRPVADLPLAGNAVHAEGHHPRHVVVVGRHAYVSAVDSDRVLHLELAGPCDGAGSFRVVGHSTAAVGSPTVAVPL